MCFIATSNLPDLTKCLIGKGAAAFLAIKDRPGLIASAALAILSLGAVYKNYTQQNDKVVSNFKVASPTFSPYSLSCSNIVLHPLSCTQSSFGKVAALIASIFLNLFSFGLIRFFCTDYPALLSKGIFQTPTSRTVHPYPGDLTADEKSKWTVKPVGQQFNTILPNIQNLNLQSVNRISLIVRRKSLSMQQTAS